jgi:Domain of unknown function (DUF4124)
MAAEAVMMTWSQRLAGALFGVLISPAHAADAVYYFVDEHGVQHFSNVPADSRYTPLTATGPTTTLPTREHLPPAGRAAPTPVLPEPTPLEEAADPPEPEPEIPASER